jgi:predicted AlkP superfamily pyrophosphatase or phosphodiesterase
MKYTFLVLVFLYSNVSIAKLTPPKLIVQIVVDQLRGDLLQNQDNFQPAGFNYLLHHSINFQNAHHPHANTVTCTGHATIATGSYPSLHGIIANEWFNRVTNKVNYCVEDMKNPILPTNRLSNIPPGRSPKNLMVSTTSDELILAQKGRAFAVSLKDRGAIMLAGHAGKAFWFDKENGGFITSTYYYKTYPNWVIAWNKQYQPKNETWSLTYPKAQYHFANAPRFDNRFTAFGQDFPHRLGDVDSTDYYKFLSMTPIADELTADFATQLLVHEQLGQSSGKTDYLAISFSAVDSIGHQFGPNSLEAEDNLLRLDKTIAKLLHKIDTQIGLSNTLIVLTADHGVTDSLTYLAEHQFSPIKAPNVVSIRKYLGEKLMKRFHLPATTIQAIEPPYIYLDHSLINDYQLTTKLVSNVIVEVLNQHPAIFQAFTLSGSMPQNDWLGDKVAKMAFTKRAGDIYTVLAPYQSDQLDTTQGNRVNHGTPWNYDSYVPLLFVNPNFKAHTIVKSVYTTDIAATLALLLHIKQPSATVGIPLTAVTQYY